MAAAESSRRRATSAAAAVVVALLALAVLTDASALLRMFVYKTSLSVEAVLGVRVGGGVLVWVALSVLWSWVHAFRGGD